MAAAADIASEPKDQEETGKLSGFRMVAEGKFGLPALLSLTVPYGEEYIDTSMLRFLRARQGDTAKSLQMLEECLELRRQEAIDTILSRPLPEVVRHHLHSCFDEGWLPEPDAHGRPVYILRGGKTGERLNKLFSAPAEGIPWELADVTENFMHWHLQMMEWWSKVGYRQLCSRAGRLVNKFVMVDDLAGMSTKGVTQIMKFVDIMKRMSAMDQLLYPEGLGVMYFVNAPFLFSGPWKAIRGLMAEETRARMHVLSAGETPEILKGIIPAAQLPDFLGGTLTEIVMTGPDAAGTDVATTPWFDAVDAYIDAQAEAAGSSFPRPPAASLSVSSRSVECVEQAVLLGETVRWEWELEGYDVTFRAAFIPDAEQPAAPDKFEPAPETEQERQAVAAAKVSRESALATATPLARARHNKLAGAAPTSCCSAPRPRSEVVPPPPAPPAPTAPPPPTPPLARQVAVDEKVKCGVSLGRQRGEYGPATAAGALRLEFDNLHSMLRSKKIRWRCAAAVV